MNPRLFLLVIASLAILNSCTKDTLTPLTEEPISGSVIDIIYEEETLSSTNTGNRFIFVAPPPSVNYDCRSTMPSVIVPKKHNQTLEFIYAKNRNYIGNDIGKIKTLKWTVNGKTQLDVSTTLKLPYQANDEFKIELIVTFTNGSTHEAIFNFEASPNIQTLADGSIIYDTSVSSFDGATISQSCVDQLNRAVSIVIIEADF